MAANPDIKGAGDAGLVGRRARQAPDVDRRGKTPDVSLVGTTWMAEFAETGALAETRDTIAKDSFLPNAWKTVTIDGKDYGVPWYVETRVLYYRTDLAKKAGWTHPP